MISYSPLRYPGGKGQMYSFVLDILEKNNLENCTYIEPFCGGAGVAMRLLFDDKVRRVVLNDLDKSIYSFWYSIINFTEDFLDILDSEEVTIDNWNKHKKIQKNKSMFDMQQKEDILKLGFSTFFLNRTNRSGIIKAGVIGGIQQNGNYKMDCRFNKSKLRKLILEISKYKSKIEIYNLDARSFINEIASKPYRGSLYFIDPPYYKKGKGLYVNHLEHLDHVEIYKSISSRLKNKKWIVTYDNCSEINDIYSSEQHCVTTLNYFLEKKRKETELLFYRNIIIN